MKDVESDMAALELDIDAAFAPKVEIGGGNSSSSEEASSSSERVTLAPPPLNAIDDDDDITSQLLSMLAEEMSQKKRKRNLKTAGPSTTGIRHRKALALASPADELKREKNRDSVKRSYYRKIVRGRTLVGLTYVLRLTGTDVLLLTVGDAGRAEGAHRVPA